MKKLDCGHLPTKTDSEFTNGIARYEGKTACYECAANFDREAIKRGEVIVGYISQDGKSVTTWPGIPLMKVTGEWTSNSGFGGKTVYYNAVAPDGKRYYGKNGGHFGGRGCVIRMKPNK